MNEVVCEGTARQMGIAQGTALASSIRDALEAVGNLEAFRLMKPRYLPFPVFRRIAEYRAARFLKTAFRSTPLDAADRLQGISEGAGISYSRLAICSLLEVALSDLVPLVTAGPNGLQAGCSAVAVTGSSSSTGHPIIAHNFDYLPIVQPHYFVRRSRPKGKLHAVMSDHGDGPSEDSVCMHSNYWNTTACIQVQSKERKLRASFSSACNADFQEFEC